LKALLDDVFRVFSNSAEASRNIQKPLLVARDQNLKCLSIPAFGGANESRFFVATRDVLPLYIHHLA
jgi:hypothetical protein